MRVVSNADRLLLYTYHPCELLVEERQDERYSTRENKNARQNRGES